LDPAERQEGPAEEPLQIAEELQEEQAPAEALQPTGTQNLDMSMESILSDQGENTQRYALCQHCLTLQLFT